MARRRISGGRREGASSAGKRTRRSNAPVATAGDGMTREPRLSDALRPDQRRELNVRLGEPDRRFIGHAPQLEDIVLPQTSDIIGAAAWVAAY